MLISGIDTPKLSAANAPKYHSDSAGRRGFMWILRRLLIKTAPPAVEELRQADRFAPP